MPFALSTVRSWGKADMAVAPRNSACEPKGGHWLDRKPYGERCGKVPNLEISDFGRKVNDCREVVKYGIGQLDVALH